MRIKSLERDVPDRFITSLQDALYALGDMGFTHARAYLLRLPTPDPVIFIYKARTNQPAFSRPQLNRPLSPEVIRTFFTELFAPYCAMDAVYRPFTTVRHFPSGTRYHQDITLRFYLGETHYTAAREVLDKLRKKMEATRSYEYFLD